MARNSVIQFNRVGFRYPGGGDLFRDLSLELDAGRFYLVQGDSGTGKSTLLRLMNNLESQSQGEILFKGRPCSDLNPARLRRSILYIQQTPLMVDGSVRENLLLPFGFKANQDLVRPDDPVLAMLLIQFSLERVDLNQNAANLSVGQQQRLCFIRGLLLSPDVILLDEPTSALDAKSSRIVETRCESLCLDQGKTVVMVSHRAFFPERVEPVVLTVADGKIAQQ